MLKDINLSHKKKGLLRVSLEFIFLQRLQSYLLDRKTSFELQGTAI